MKNNDIVKIEKEIQENYDAIEKLKKLIPLGILTMTTFSFVYPIIPGSRSGSTLADWLSYPYAVIACSILSGLVYFFGYRIAVKRRKNIILDLERKRCFEKLDNNNR